MFVDYLIRDGSFVSGWFYLILLPLLELCDGNLFIFSFWKRGLCCISSKGIIPSPLSSSFLYELVTSYSTYSMLQFNYLAVKGRTLQPSEGSSDPSCLRCSIDSV